MQRSECPAARPEKDTTEESLSVAGNWFRWPEDRVAVVVATRFQDSPTEAVVAAHSPFSPMAI
jgi:hypothetical protein